MGKGKASSGEGSLPLGVEPKLDLDAAKAAEEAELAALLAEEEAAKAKAEADAKAAELEVLAERDRLDHEAVKAAREALAARPDPIRTAEPRLVTKGADSSDEEPAHGPRVRLASLGTLQWDGVEYAPGVAFTVDTRKHTEEAFNALVAAGVLVEA